MPRPVQHKPRQTQVLSWNQEQCALGVIGSDVGEPWERGQCSTHLHLVVLAGHVRNLEEALARKHDKQLSLASIDSTRCGSVHVSEKVENERICQTPFWMGVFGSSSGQDCRRGSGKMEFRAVIHAELGRSVAPEVGTIGSD